MPACYQHLILVPFFHPFVILKQSYGKIAYFKYAQIFKLSFSVKCVRCFYYYGAWNGCGSKEIDRYFCERDFVRDF